jgi:hypothetical protein
MRYQVRDGSQSFHCCFGYTVVDTTKPVMVGDQQYNNQFEAVCECYDEDDANAIADALNAKESS